MNETIRLLLIEDMESDAELVYLELEKGGFGLEPVRVETEPDLRKMLREREWDLIISDFAMPRFDGLRAFDIYREMKLDAPFIFVSGALGEERAVAAMRAGARDYLVKGHLARLNAVVRRELEEARARRAARLAEEEQRRERQALEEQLRRAQKMEAVGRLAGGVAHDFNNILTAIISFTGFAQDRLDAENPMYDDLQQVLAASDRAAKLTSQLLAFSRHKPIEPRSLRVDDVILDIEKMLRRIVGADVGFDFEFPEDLWNVFVDPGALEQVVVNLCVNARDAMPDGGRIGLHASNVKIAEPPPGIEPGQFIRLCISDSGCGIDEENLKSIFEPFFTTKDSDKGTGLGLSTCYGIVKQAGGWIDVETAVDEGTTFLVFLPRTEAEVSPPSVDIEPVTTQGGETILMVEDDPQVRAVVARGLRRSGYEVIAAENGAEALRLAAEYEGPIDLLLTDVVMPGPSGRAVADQIRETFAGIKVLYMSGHSANVIARQGVLEPGTQLLNKPFSVQALSVRVRQVLDS